MPKQKLSPRLRRAYRDLARAARRVRRLQWPPKQKTGGEPEAGTTPETENAPRAGGSR